MKANGTVIEDKVGVFVFKKMAINTQVCLRMIKWMVEENIGFIKQIQNQYFM
jgi:hypothetical protein